MSYTNVVFSCRHTNVYCGHCNIRDHLETSKTCDANLNWIIANCNFIKFFVAFLRQSKYDCSQENTRVSLYEKFLSFASKLCFFLSEISNIHSWTYRNFTRFTHRPNRILASIQLVYYLVTFTIKRRQLISSRGRLDI